MNNLGRDKLSWSQDAGGPWSKIDHRVHDETAQTKVAARFLPFVPPDPNNMSIMVVPADTIKIEDSIFAVDQGDVKPLLEISVEFKLTKEQVDKEDKVPTAVTLATRAANLISLGQDLLIFQGKAARDTRPFKENLIQYRGPADPGDGLVQSGEKGGKVINVDPIVSGSGQTKKWGENTFARVAEGFSDLQDKDISSPTGTLEIHAHEGIGYRNLLYPTSLGRSLAVSKPGTLLRRIEP